MGTLLYALGALLVGVVAFILGRGSVPHPATLFRRPWVRLGRGLLCINPECEAIFESPNRPCPGCGERQFWPVASFLDRAKEVRE